jgi:hypothetical protein
VTTITKPKKSNQGKSRDKEKDKKKIIHGSLPNHLDTDIDYEGSDDTNSSSEYLANCFSFVLILDRLCDIIVCIITSYWFSFSFYLVGYIFLI